MDFHASGEVLLEVVQTTHLIHQPNALPQDSDIPCTEIVVQSDSPEIYLLLGHQDLMTIQGLVRWSIVEDPPLP